jgi:hypothetical protein
VHHRCLVLLTVWWYFFLLPLKDISAKSYFHLVSTSTSCSLVVQSFIFLWLYVSSPTSSLLSNQMWFKRKNNRQSLDANQQDFRGNYFCSVCNDLLLSILFI